MESCSVCCGVSFGFAMPAAWRQSLRYSFRCITDTEGLIFKVMYDCALIPKETIEMTVLLYYPWWEEDGNGKGFAAKCLSRNTRQLGLRMSVPRVSGSGSGTSPLWLAHMLCVLLSVNLAASQPQGVPIAGFLPVLQASVCSAAPALLRLNTTPCSATGFGQWQQRSWVQVMGK